jgi:hypothetical protein
MSFQDGVRSQEFTPFLTVLFLNYPPRLPRTHTVYRESHRQPAQKNLPAIKNRISKSVPLLLFEVPHASYTFLCYLVLCMNAVLIGFLLKGTQE